MPTTRDTTFRGYSLFRITIFRQIEELEIERERGVISAPALFTAFLSLAFSTFTLELHCAHINYIIFAHMAQKKKKKAADSPKNKPGKTNPSPFKPDKEERIDWRGLARDERTWKITGAVSLLISIFLFIAFISYFFTWKEDQDKVFRGASILFDQDIKVNNLLGRLGAYISHSFIYKGFGIASLLVCTFFFVVGVNLLFNRRVFSITRNLKYVTVGLLVLSVSLAFLFALSCSCSL